MKLVNSNQQFIEGSKANSLSLDEMYELAERLGKVEIGGIGGRAQVSIKLHSTGSDYVTIRCRDSQKMKENLAKCISRAEIFKKFYDNIGI